MIIVVQNQKALNQQVVKPKVLKSLQAVNQKAVQAAIITMKIVTAKVINQLMKITVIKKIQNMKNQVNLLLVVKLINLSVSL